MLTGAHPVLMVLASCWFVRKGTQRAKRPRQVDTDLRLGKTPKTSPIPLKWPCRDLGSPLTAKRGPALLPPPPESRVLSSNLRAFLLQSHYVGGRRGVLGRFCIPSQREIMDLGRVSAWYWLRSWKLVNGCMGLWVSGFNGCWVLGPWGVRPKPPFGRKYALFSNTYRLPWLRPHGGMCFPSNL